MKYLLIIYRQPDTAEALCQNFTADGYRVRLMEAGLLDFSKFDRFAHDLVIINLGPDISTGWKLFLDFKKRFPYLPVIFYVRDLYSLRYAVKQVLRPKRPRGTGRYKRNSFFMPPGRLHLTMPETVNAADNPETGLYQSIRYLKWIQWFSREWETDASQFTIKNDEAGPVSTQN